jgi:uncharacterized protein YrrD
MDLGLPSSYKALAPGTPVYSADGQKVGTVAHVLADESEDVFDGIVVSEHMGEEGHRFADADDVDRIGDRGVQLKLDRAACLALPEPTANPAVVHDDPSTGPGGRLEQKLRRAWDYISGKY